MLTIRNMYIPFGVYFQRDNYFEPISSSFLIDSICLHLIQTLAAAIRILIFKSRCTRERECYHLELTACVAPVPVQSGYKNEFTLVNCNKLLSAIWRFTFVGNSNAVCEKISLPYWNWCWQSSFPF